MLARRARNGVSSLLTLGLLLLPAGFTAASGQQTQPDKPLVELAAEGAPEGFELQEVTAVAGEALEGADELISAKYLGAGSRNEIRYRTFSTDQAARDFLGSIDDGSCSPDGLAECVTRQANVVVSGLSASTCPHPTHDMVVRAETLMNFGVEKVSG